MRVTQVSLMPSRGAAEAGRPALTPELLAATGARYSRNNEGLEAILSIIDWDNPDASVDRIFQMVDYGHASIADMAPVAIFIDDIALWLAYRLWTLSAVAAGQESSTRYILIAEDAVIDEGLLGIPGERIASFRAGSRQLFSCYASALELWEDLAARRPELLRLPAQALGDDKKSVRVRERMTRNFAFDRARPFLPLAAKTSVMMLMSARAWAEVATFLLSDDLPEANAVGEMVRSELGLATPRMIRHAKVSTPHERHLAEEFAIVRRMAASPLQGVGPGAWAAPPTPFLDVMAPTRWLPQGPDGRMQGAVDALAYRETRYSPVGSLLARTSVRYGWDAVSVGELRDMNRHRPGTRYAPFVPVGFYASLDQVPADEPAMLAALSELADQAASIAAVEPRAALAAGERTYVYHMALGTQVPFEHVNTADKFIYEAELRTGTGAHYRYADHYRAMLALWYERYPETRGVVLEGSAEPE